MKMPQNPALAVVMVICLGEFVCVFWYGVFWSGEAGVIKPR